MSQAAYKAGERAGRKDVEADAARYRWIKSRTGLTLRTDGSIWQRPDGSTFIATHYIAADGTQHAPADSLNATIDEAMKRSTK